MYLMHKNKKVLEFDIDRNIYHILDEQMLPYGLRNVFIQYDINMSDEEKIAVRTNNHVKFIHFLAGRMLTIERENAKKILNAYHLSQDQTDYNKACIAISCRAVSMTDCYWINNEQDICWENIDPKRNHLNDIVAHIALKGSSLTLTGEPHTPELTGQGAYAKAWQRIDGETYLLKAAGRYGNEEDIEVCVSKILDCFNVAHVKYEKDYFEDKPVSKCLNMTSDQYSIVSAEEISGYCNRTGLDFLQTVLSIDAESIYKMCIVDYLIANSDRHGKNWGFYVNNDTRKIVSCHPLFDHNNAFDEEQMADPTGGASLIFHEKNKQEAALYALQRCVFECIAPVKREIFLSDKMYQSFMRRAVELKLYKKNRPTLVQKIGLRAFEEYEPVEIFGMRAEARKGV
jgi:hypothetical protein